jgi:hypothetical protein
MGRRRRTKAAESLLPVEGVQLTAGSGSEQRIDALPVGLTSPVTVRGVLERLSLVIAPSTLVIALAFWFGWTLTNARSAYFGIDSSTLGYSTTDYLLRSADAAFVPIAVTLLVILIAIMIHGLVRHAATTDRGRKAVVLGAVGGMILGIVLTLFAIWAMFDSLPVATYYLVPPVILGLGPTFTAYSAWILRHLRAPNEAKANRAAVPAWERSGYAIAAMIVLLGIFWAASLYASALGRGRAENLAENLSSRPAVTIFSVKSLGIDALGVTATRITSASSAYKFRYSGLRLLIYSAGKYFLVNDGWSHEHGVAMVIQDAPDIRVEFTPGG